MPVQFDWKLFLLALTALGWLFEKLWRRRGQDLEEVKDAQDEIKQSQVSYEGRINTVEESVSDTKTQLSELKQSLAEVRENAIQQPDINRVQEALSERIDSLKGDLGGRIDRLAERLKRKD